MGGGGSLAVASASISWSAFFEAASFRGPLGRGVVVAGCWPLEAVEGLGQRLANITVRKTEFFEAVNVLAAMFSHPG